MTIGQDHSTSQAALVSDTTALYVDLDGTLIQTDLLWESLLSALRRHPWAALLALLQLWHGRAQLKRALAALADIDAAALPFNEPFVQWLRTAAQSGRPVWLATAADERLALDVARHLGFLAGVLASDGQRNLKGARKLQAIVDHCGGAAFDYCGNGPEDLVLFEAARHAIVVGASRSVARAAAARAHVSLRFDGNGARALIWLRAVRAHQWAKNLLLFVPLLTSFNLGKPSSVAAAVLGFAAFSLVASAGYLINDLLDLAADRSHPRKRHRPLASGRIGVPAAIGAALAGMAGGLALAASVSPALAAWIGFYAVLTLAYSSVIKRIAIADLIALAALYTVRILAGGAAIGVEVSFWLLAFSVFLFFSLATVKRCAELVSMRSRHQADVPGRGYRGADLPALQALGVATSVASVLVLALFVQSPDVAVRYASPRMLWGVLTGLLAWLAHLWLQTGRGDMHDDPLVFTARDAGSRWLILAMAVSYACAVLLGSG